MLQRRAWVTLRMPSIGKGVAASHVPTGMSRGVPLAGSCLLARTAAWRSRGGVSKCASSPGRQSCHAGRLHRRLGLPSGLYIFSVSFSGGGRGRAAALCTYGSL